MPCQEQMERVHVREISFKQMPLIIICSLWGIGTNQGSRKLHFKLQLLFSIFHGKKVHEFKCVLWKGSSLLQCCGSAPTCFVSQESRALTAFTLFLHWADCELAHFLLPYSSL